MSEEVLYNLQSVYEQLIEQRTNIDEQLSVLETILNNYYNTEVDW